uniref:CHK kinase-like domain-containing protein n=1 Tax=viral metagenome TaxID=1070528 RepID=A0A6C0HZT6_9ZZZZ
MNIIIPLGGKGERFSKNGYTIPKPLIRILDKTMIEYVLDNIHVSEHDHIFIIYNEVLDCHSFVPFLSQKNPSIKFIRIQDTKGAVETLSIGLKQIINNGEYYQKSIILDCDTFYTEDILSIFRESDNNMVFYTKNIEEQPIYSYIELDISNQIINIKEKEKISDNANTGAYAFTDIHELYKYCNYILENNITFQGEPYTSCVISEMICNQTKFIGHELNYQHVISLGTPTAISQYIDNTYAFLFDLDGTLVITDDIYYEVWDTILKKYNIQLTSTIFKNYIRGNNDTYVLYSLLFNVPITIEELSEEKDRLFIKYINQVYPVNGSIEFIKKLKKLGHKVCIVTNCNRPIAEKIVEYIGIKPHIDFIIASQDCQNGKPDGEPYSNAIGKYNIANNKCIIFEDSTTGIISGKTVTPRLLIGLETSYSSEELQQYGCDLSIKNFIDIDIDNLLQTRKGHDHFLCSLLKSHLTQYNIKDIILDNIKLKGGFIADVISFKIHTVENNKYSLIIKYENKEENGLSTMAKQLDLYNREYYFYTNISKLVPIKIPEFIQIIKNEHFETLGIVLENLFEKGYKVNLNLNQESINISLKIVDQMAKMHSKFWNKPLKMQFPELKYTTDPIFSPFLSTFINERIDTFKLRWKSSLLESQINICDKIVGDFSNIQKRFSTGSHLTFIHGDIKSPNIFYDENCDPHFIDWQHCGIGKGVQDLIFFIIESFDISQIKIVYPILKSYYYKRLIEYGITNYTMEEYDTDVYDALCYIPFFTSIWFGTVPQEELIDKNFPFFFIKKMFFLMELQSI